MQRLPPLPRSSWPRHPIPTWVFRLVLVWAALVLVLHPPAPSSSAAPSQAFIGFIIAAITTIASWFGAAAGAVANASVAILEWTLRGLSWIGDRVVNLVKATGAMFSKVWEGARSLWFDVLRPALQKIYGWITDVRKWLKDKLAPAFRLLAKVRQHIRDIYAHFVRPILDAIEMTRGVLKILEVLHVPFAKALDRYLAEAESVIAENFLRLQGWVIDIQNILTSIVTGDLLFQRVPFLATLRRDTPFWVRMWWNAQMRSWSPDFIAQLQGRKSDLNDPAEYAKQLGEFLNTGGGELAPVIQELVPLWFLAAHRESKISIGV